MESSIRRRLRRFRNYWHLRDWRDYRKQRDAEQLVRYIGWAGHRNVGDDALYLAFKRQLCGRALVLPIDDFSPLSMRSRHWPSSTAVLGGGTLINVDSYLAPLENLVARGEGFVVFGTGVADLDFWSRHPGQGRGHADRWLRVLRSARHIGVRGPRSLQWLAENGIDHAEVVGDPALSLTTPTDAVSARGGAGRVGMNLGSHDPVNGGQDRTLQAALALGRHLLSRGLQIRYVSLSDGDHRLGRMMAAQLDHAGFELLPFSIDVDRTLRDIAGCDWLVGQRLHATVLASALGVPNLSLSYQPKCLDFLESIGCEELSVDTAQISGHTLVGRFEDLVAECRHWRTRLRDRCGQYRRLQQQRAQAFGWA
jgi:hypothetical protein